MYQRIPKSPSENSPIQQKSSQLAQRSTVQAKQNSPRSLTKEENENKFGQNWNEASQLQLKEKSGPLTSAEQQKLSVLQAKMNGSWVQRREKAAQFGHNIANIPVSSTAMIQKRATQEQRPNKTGLPDDLKLGLESTSGYSLDHVKVHYNSQKPAEIQAHAYIQGGTDIYVAPGREKDLPHEGQHALQWMQGKVGKPTSEVNGVKINNDRKLEKEADVMGSKALKLGQSLQNEEAVQRSLWENERENQSKTRLESKGLANNLVQRKVKYNPTKNELVKSGRLEFSSELQNAMKLDSGQHRCHTISYETITSGVKDSVNCCLAAGNNLAIGKLQGLVNAVFPNGPTSKVHSNNDLKNIAQRNYQKATNAITNISRNLANSTVVADNANELIGALNNSPDNLRPGAGNTNSSIQGALDLTPKKTDILPVGTQIVDADDNVVKTLQSSLTVLRVDNTHEKQVKTLLTETYSKNNKLEVYSSGKKLQSSDIAGMTAEKMSNKNPTNLAIDWGGGKYFLFDI